MGMYEFGMTVTHACLVAQSLHIAIETRSWVRFFRLYQNLFRYLHTLLIVVFDDSFLAVEHLSKNKNPSLGFEEKCSGA